MAKRLLVALCVLALLCQPVAMAEDITTPSDLPLFCEACGGEAQLSWIRDADGSHVAVCPHGVVSEKSRHAETGSAGYISVSDTEHAVLCYCGLVNETMTALLVASGDTRHVSSCTNPSACANCGATGVTFAGVKHKSSWVYEHDDTNHWKVCEDCGEKINQLTHKASCDQPTVCYVCGAEGVSFDGVEHADYVYDHDETSHWWVCTKCGEIFNVLEHHANCDNPTVCIRCGAENVTMGYVFHSWPDEYEYNAGKHWQVCTKCGEREEWWHYADCDNPTVCAACGAEGVVMISTDHSWPGEYEHDATKHWYVCTDCGERVEAKHSADCGNPTVCRDCGAEGVTMDDVFHSWPEGYEYDATMHWQVCAECGERGEWKHAAYCNNPTVCYECGAEGITMNSIRHNRQNQYEYDETKHWYVCADCGERVETQHYAYCGSPTVCYICGAEDVTTNYAHNMPDGYEYDGTNHWQYCLDCNEKVVEPHEPSAEDPTKCAVCGVTISGSPARPTDAPTTAPTDAPTAAPTAEPTEAPTEAPTATPTATPIPLPTVTAAPTRNPSTNNPAVTRTPAHEHTYDIAFISNNDATHSKTCTADDCDETLTESCTLVTTDMGLMTCTACAKCGYAVYTAKAGVAALTEGENVPAVITRVENASIAPADETAADVVPADTALVVHETTFEVPVTLSEEIQGTVEKVFTAALIKDGETIQPSGQVKLRIPVDEETVAALEGKVLMLLKEDGTLVEVPFEIIDGEIVFLTEELGVFLLMTPEA